ncbi:hypothetical protein [Adonisia turfae]
MQQDKTITYRRKVLHLAAEDSPDGRGYIVYRTRGESLFPEIVPVPDEWFDCCYDDAGPEAAPAPGGALHEHGLQALEAVLIRSIIAPALAKTTGQSEVVVPSR